MLLPTAAGCSQAVQKYGRWLTAGVTSDRAMHKQQAEIDTGESSRYVRKSRIRNSLPFVVPFHVGAYFCMGAYKHNVIKMGAYIHGVLILCGCLLSRFYSI